MIVVSGFVDIQAQKREEAVEIVAAVVNATKLEAGCIRYDFYCDLADPCRFHVFEEWETDEALESHFQTKHMEIFLAHLNTLVSSEPAVYRYEVTGISQLL